MTELQKKSIWWCITAYDKDIALCEGTLPEFVRSILGGRETCPKTGRLHFQGALQCFEQVRGAKIKSWLPTAHLEAARKVEALKKYAMKAETAAGEKVVRKNSIPHYTAHEICLLLAQTSRQTDTGFWPRARIILRETPELAGQLMNPSLRGFFEKTQEVWMERAAIVLQQPTSTTSVCDCGRDECMTCYEQEILDLDIDASSQASGHTIDSPHDAHRRCPKSAVSGVIEIEGFV